MIFARPKLLQTPSCIFLLSLLQQINTIIHTNPKGNFFSYQNHIHPLEIDIKLNKVSLTQRGYIQFLRYFNEVPPLSDYTFCIWVRSNNLTYNHPLLSYSKNEEERLIRVWLSPKGLFVNLEIMEVPAFNVPVGFIENKWYHLCQSWSSHSGAWGLFLNGKLASSGYEPKLKSAIIPGGGDIVVGQEYTDFDKGLDDGIEGDIFGFNFILAPTFSLSIPLSPIFPSHNLLKRHSDQGRLVYPDSNDSSDFPEDLSTEEESEFLISSSKEEADRPPPFSYLMSESNRQPKTFTGIFHQIFDLFQPGVTLKTRKYGDNPMEESSNSRVLHDIEDYRKPRGMQLVEMSFHCRIGKGAPLKGKDVLIHWNLTPVRVFGGAILKSVPAFC